MRKSSDPGYSNSNCFHRLSSYNLSDENDDLANYLILSLQNDMIVPNIAVIYYFVRVDSI